MRLCTNELRECVWRCPEVYLHEARGVRFACLVVVVRGGGGGCLDGRRSGHTVSARTASLGNQAGVLSSDVPFRVTMKDAARCQLEPRITDTYRFMLLCI